MERTKSGKSLAHELWWLFRKVDGQTEFSNQPQNIMKIENRPIYFNSQKGFDASHKKH